MPTTRDGGSGPDERQPAPTDGSPATRLRVCYIISSFDPVIGGAEVATQALVAALRQRGHDVAVVTRRYSRDLAPFEHVDGIPVYRLGRPGVGKLNALTFAVQALVLLVRRLRDRQILHVQNIDTPLLVGLVAGTVLRRRLFATIHGQTQIEGRTRTRLGRLRTRLMAHVVEGFTSINPENSAALRGVGVPPARIFEIPNGVDTEVFRPSSGPERAEIRAALGLPEDELVTVYVGRLIAWKRVDLLIEAWARLDEPSRGQLLIIGDGSYAEDLRPIAAEVPGVRLVGVTRRPVRYLQAADIYVNASGVAGGQVEGLSVSLLEAMAVGLPPVVTKGAGNDVLVTDGVTGLSFPVGDADALERCLKRLLDPALRADLGRAASDLVRQRYSVAAVAEQVEAMYLRDAHVLGD